MIGVLDYGMGNVGSIINILKKIGYKAIKLENPNELSLVSILIIPGVGSFDNGVKNLKSKNFYDAIKEFSNDKNKLIVGICLGMQLLGESSEEGTEVGLGLIPFKNIRFKLSDSKFKIPNMGWSYVKLNKNIQSSIFFEVPQRYYFVHSYHAQFEDDNFVLMWSKYGYEFPAGIKKENIIGFQFHPEKSHKFGMDLLKQILKSENDSPT